MFNGNNKKRNESWNNHNQQPHNLTQNRFPSVQTENPYMNQNVFNCEINQAQPNYHHTKEYPIIAGNKPPYYPDYHHASRNSINYELFVNNTYANVHGGEPSQPSEEYLLFAQQQQQHQQMTAALSHEFIQQQQQQQQQTQPDNVQNTTNMLINQFVGNWTPNVSGTYTPFGETGIKLSELSKMNESTQPIIVQATQPKPILLTNEPAVMQNTNIVHAGERNLSSSDLRAGTFIKPTAPVQHMQQEVKKPRIVAEVKPMRMSYSDVLSKNVINEKKENNAYNNYNINSTNQIDAINGSTNKASKVLHDKNKYNNGMSIIQPTNSTYEKKSANSATYASDEKESLLPKIKKSHGNSTKILSSDSMASNGMSKNIKKVYPVIDEKGGRVEENNKENPISLGTSGKKQNKLKGKNKHTQQYGDYDKKRDQRYNYHQQQQHSSEDENLSSYEQQNYEYSYYNVTESIGNNHTYEKQSSSSSSTASSSVALAAAAAASSASGACSKQSHIIKRKNATTRYNNKIDKNMQQSQQQTVLANSSLTHQTSNKRCNRINNKKNNKKYAYFIKLCEKWLEFMLKILTWFKALLSDIVFLSFGIVWDKLNSGYEYSLNCYHSLKIELKNNSGFPMTLFKKFYRKIDARFTKNSKWAFWRNIYRKKIPEQANDFYKDGRLPQTGDEAMYSLLNCKGKDAYSILGVTQECTQELIRKHYKKLAVLVHPDKNKQPGAEEAFKILQRAFELIGEPENRKNYDQSLAEVLNAEKAWSELNDLLTQLHTKIVEAANTIRCSSCSLRHPRKPTGRPHYAARECASCKIRHSAREGDIWAETTFFGLRWKYLALMEGNVYDITEWANCQRGALTHLQPNAHLVQYRIVLGGQQQQQAQQPHHQQQQNNQQQQHQQYQQDKEKIKRDQTTNEPNLDEFLNNLYKGSKQQPPATHHASNRKRSKKN